MSIRAYFVYIYVFMYYYMHVYVHDVRFVPSASHRGASSSRAIARFERLRDPDRPPPPPRRANFSRESIASVISIILTKRNPWEIDPTANCVRHDFRLFDYSRIHSHLPPPPPSLHSFRALVEADSCNAPESTTGRMIHTRGLARNGARTRRRRAPTVSRSRATLTRRERLDPRLLSRYRRMSQHAPRDSRRDSRNRNKCARARVWAHMGTLRAERSRDEAATAAKLKSTPG